VPVVAERFDNGALPGNPPSSVIYMLLRSSGLSIKAHHQTINAPNIATATLPSVTT
jgi:hypothetical protein